MFGIDKELAKELINSVLKIGHEELGILKAQEFPYSKQWYLRDINPIECEEFKNKGGFKQYFCMIENDRKLLDKKSRLELIKIKTDVIKNIGSITADSNLVSPKSIEIYGNPVFINNYRVFRSLLANF